MSSSTVRLPPLTTTIWYDKARRGVIDAMDFALAKHGPVTSDPVRGALNLAEECGEVASEALEATRQSRGGKGSSDGSKPNVDYLHRMCAELDQVAAYAIMLRLSMDRIIQKETK